MGHSTKNVTISSGTLTDLHTPHKHIHTNFVVDKSKKKKKRASKSSLDTVSCCVAYSSYLV